LNERREEVVVGIVVGVSINKIMVIGGMLIPCKVKERDRDPFERSRLLL